MSVTIVTAPSVMASATAGVEDTSSKLAESGDSSASLDFASFLLGQLMPVVPQSTTATDTATPESAASESTTPTDAAAAVLASLGITPQAQVQTSGNELPEGESGQLNGISKGSATPLPLTERQAATMAESALKPADVSSETIVDPAVSSSLATDDKPAKFAVPVLSEAIKENTPAKGLVTDAQTTPVSPLASNATAHSNATQQSHSSSLSVPTPISDKNWSTDFGQKIVWLANNDKQAAQLTLNPPQMGPIDISLNIDKGNATASFVSTNADVREALETAMPRLREMFANAGISLGQTNVSAESFKQAGSEWANNGSTSSSWARDNAILGADSAGPLPGRTAFTQRGNGMVDIFA